MNKDEIDLSAYPVYLGVRSDAEESEGSRTREAVVRGLAVAALAGLVGVAVGAVLEAHLIGPTILSRSSGAVTSVVMVLLYTRAAGSAPRRGLVPLLVLVVLVLAASAVAILAGRAWWVYSVPLGGLDIGMTRNAFIWDVVRDMDISGTWPSQFVLLTAYTVLGSSATLLMVRHRTED